MCKDNPQLGILSSDRHLIMQEPAHNSTQNIDLSSILLDPSINNAWYRFTWSHHPQVLWVGDCGTVFSFDMRMRPTRQSVLYSVGDNYSLNRISFTPHTAISALATCPFDIPLVAIGSPMSALLVDPRYPKNPVLNFDNPLADEPIRVIIRRGDRHYKI